MISIVREHLFGSCLKVAKDCESTFNPTIKRYPNIRSYKSDEILVTLLNI